MSLITTQFVEKAHTLARREEGRLCRNWCKISIAVDVFTWILQIFGMNCGPLTILAYYMFGLVVAMESELASLPDALMLLAQMATTVGYGSISFGEDWEQGTYKGLKLWHSLHSWVGVVMVQTQWDDFIDSWLHDVMIATTEAYEMPKQFLAVLLLLLVTAASSFVYAFDLNEAEKECMLKFKTLNHKFLEWGAIPGATAVNINETKYLEIKREIENGYDVIDGVPITFDMLIKEDGLKDLCPDSVWANENIVVKNTPVHVTGQTGTQLLRTGWFAEWNSDHPDTNHVFKAFVDPEGSTFFAEVSKSGGTKFDRVFDSDGMETYKPMDSKTIQNTDGVWTLSPGAVPLQVKKVKYGWTDDNAWGRSTIDLMEFRGSWKEKPVTLYFQDTRCGKGEQKNLCDGYSDFTSNLMDAMYMCSMSFSSVGYGDYAPETDWGKTLSPLMMSMGTHMFNMAKDSATVENADQRKDLWKGMKKPGVLFKEWIDSCLPFAMQTKKSG